MSREVVPADGMRASDAERERVVDELRAHAGEGRLDVEELEERIGSAQAARTRAELAGLLRDLPRRADSSEPLGRAVAQAALAAHVRLYVLVMALLVVTWALTGAGYFWPAWPALGWGVGVAAQAACTPRRRRGPAVGGGVPARR